MFPYCDLLQYLLQIKLKKASRQSTSSQTALIIPLFSIKVEKETFQIINFTKYIFGLKN